MLGLVSKARAIRGRPGALEAHSLGRVVTKSTASLTGSLARTSSVVEEALIRNFAASEIGTVALEVHLPCLNMHLVSEKASWTYKVLRWADVPEYRCQ